MNEIEYLKNNLKKVNIELNENQINQFCLIFNELKKWNEMINLTTINEEKQIILRHFIDSMIPSRYVDENSKIIDVGSGAGFPGIPLRILKKDITLDLIDTVGKKVNYINNLISVLNLEKTNAIHTRAEDLAQNSKYREKYDIVISRALANMTTLVEYLIPFACIGGKILCMKGPNIDDELETSKKAIKLLGGEIEDVFKYKLMDMEVFYNIVVIRKVNNTPSIYPRKAGIPSKKPLN